ncbi:hypothetical protein Adt_39492 [Abeliophyllum distichum]|uniref:Uncharacterized protein n=1 Tax=Abeliophyllum distichum TaxID=126358 RepID=A0ABD1Q9F3_9LAMI
MNLIRGLVLTKEVCSTLEGFDGKLDKEEANSKKLSKDLNVMSLEKVQLDLKYVNEAQKLANGRALVAETAIVTANSNFEAMVAEKNTLLAKAKEEVERVKTDRVDAEARAFATCQDGFEDMPNYKDLAHHFMTAGRE